MKYCCFEDRVSEAIPIYADNSVEAVAAYLRIRPTARVVVVYDGYIVVVRARIVGEREPDEIRW